MSDVQLNAHRHGKNSALIEQQAARIAALEDVLRALVDLPHAGGQRVDVSGRAQWVCIYCGVHSPAVHPFHDEDCPVARARALLESRA